MSAETVSFFEIEAAAVWEQVDDLEPLEWCARWARVMDKWQHPCTGYATWADWYADVRSDPKYQKKIELEDVLAVWPEIIERAESAELKSLLKAGVAPISLVFGIVSLKVPLDFMRPKVGRHLPYLEQVLREKLDTDELDVVLAD